MRRERLRASFWAIRGADDRREKTDPVRVRENFDFLILQTITRPSAIGKLDGPVRPGTVIGDRRSQKLSLVLSFRLADFST
jgi:hypothetical protein